MDVDRKSMVESCAGYCIYVGRLATLMVSNVMGPALVLRYLLQTRSDCKVMTRRWRVLGGVMGPSQRVTVPARRVELVGGASLTPMYLDGATWVGVW